ncbi:MAG: dihydropteroate synthase [Alphaproteobacteria bacterium]|jgi:5-methyltetrahydrofolate--homocysteine methyltransferase|nr:dihydropteroate synthase [Alphaproteobacteria bacterium]
MIVVAERINSTRSAIEPALAARDAEFLLDEARRQWQAGSDYLDVNTAKLMEGEEDCMTWLVGLIQEAIPEALIAIDSPNPKALEAGLKAHRGRPLLNSITAESERVEAVLPLIREFQPRVVALTMDDGGLHRDADKRYEIGARLIEMVGEAGIAPEDIFVDPLVFPVGAEDNAGIIALDIMAKLKVAYPGVHTICGLSNVSFGLPLRSQINQVYMVMAMSRGLDAVIIDPLDRRMMANIVTARMLAGDDAACKGFLSAYRDGRLDVVNPAK